MILGGDTRETFIVEDLGTWVAGVMEVTPDGAIDPLIHTLAGAVAASAAKVVLVSAEVGLGLVPLTAIGRAFADSLGTVNQAVAGSCDTVALTVAGQVLWLKGGP